MSVDPKEKEFLLAVRRLERRYGLYLRTSEFLLLEDAPPNKYAGVFSAAGCARWADIATTVNELIAAERAEIESESAPADELVERAAERASEQDESAE